MATDCEHVWRSGKASAWCSKCGDWFYVQEMSLPALLTERDTLRADNARLTAKVRVMRDAHHVRMCSNCGGTGHLGRSRDGRFYSCELCGGHEDALGRGYLAYDDETENLRVANARLTAELASLRKAQLDCHQRDQLTIDVLESDFDKACADLRAAERRLAETEDACETVGGKLTAAEAANARLTAEVERLRKAIRQELNCNAGMIYSACGLGEGRCTCLGLALCHALEGDPEPAKGEGE